MPDRHQIGPYSRPNALDKRDGRTREAKLMASTRAELLRHVGADPSITQRMTIERAVQLTIRIAAMDRKFAETGTQTDHDQRTYCAWVGTLTRLLRDLGMHPAAERAPTLAEVLAAPMPASTGVAA